MRVYSAINSSDLSRLKIDRWYDKSTRNWIVTLRDPDGHQVGDSIVVYRRDEAMSIKKDHPSFNLCLGPTDPTDDLDVATRKQLQGLIFFVSRNLGKTQIWRVSDQSLLYTVVDQLDLTTLVIKVHPSGRKTEGSSLTLLQELRAGKVRISLGSGRELKYQQLLRWQ